MKGSQNILKDRVLDYIEDDDLYDFSQKRAFKPLSKPRL